MLVGVQLPLLARDSRLSETLEHQGFREFCVSGTGRFDHERAGTRKHWNHCTRHEDEPLRPYMDVRLDMTVMLELWSHARGGTRSARSNTTSSHWTDDERDDAMVL